jgi:hypothetical protein
MVWNRLPNARDPTSDQRPREIPGFATSRDDAVEGMTHRPLRRFVPDGPTSRRPGRRGTPLLRWSGSRELWWVDDPTRCAAVRDSCCVGVSHRELRRARRAEEDRVRSLMLGQWQRAVSFHPTTDPAGHGRIWRAPPTRSDRQFAAGCPSRAFRQLEVAAQCCCGPTAMATVPDLERPRRADRLVATHPAIDHRWSEIRRSVRPARREASKEWIYRTPMVRSAR